MEPSDPIIDLDTGEPIQLGTDIGVDPRDRRGPTQPTGGAPGGSPIKVVALIAGIVAAASLVFSVFGGSDRAVDRALPQPAPEPSPTVPVADPDGVGDPVPVDDDGGRVARAGEPCLARPAAGEPALGAVVRFVVPDGLSAHECRRFGTDPASARAGDALRFEVVLGETDLNRSFVTWAADRAPDRMSWNPIDGRRGWRLDFDQPSFAVPESRWASSVLVVEVPGGSMTVTARANPDGPLSRVETLDAFEQLVGSIEIAVPEPDPFHYYREPGGWCSGEDYVTRVPDGWFADPNCRWLNTSSESPIVLQCNCLPPLFLQRLTIPFDGDFGFTEISLDRIESRADGTPVRVVEGLRPDPNNQERPIRAMIVDGGDARVAVVASLFTEHTLPVHTYEDTLAAQQEMIDALRFHSGSACGVGQRWVAASDDGDIGLRLAGDDIVGIPSGSTLLGTGCTQRESGELEVRLLTNPDLIGWVDAAEVRSPEVTLCPSGEGVFDPRRWQIAATGDFDGDGREDTAYVRSLDTAPGFGDLPSAAVLYANGGLALGAVDDPESRAPLPGSELTTRRIPGVGHDLIEVRSSARGRQTYELLDVSACVFRIAGWAGLENGPDARSGVCEVRTEIGSTLRVWAGSVDPHQGLVREVDELWRGLDGRLLFSRAPWENDEPPCGPHLPEQRLIAIPGSSGTSLAGSHALTLQWASSGDDSSGVVEFRPIGDERYEAEGRHVVPGAGHLDLIGVIRVVDDDTLAFEGTITTEVDGRNEGEPCVRRAGQRFVRLAGTDVFRLQDAVNCDGVSTDLIDVVLRPPTLD